MKITNEMYDKIKNCFPKHRKTPRYSNLEVLNAMLCALENGCKWRRLPEKFGDWHVVYERILRWSKQGILETVFGYLQKLVIISIKVRIKALDSTCAKVHPDAHGALKKTESKQ